MSSRWTGTIVLVLFVVSGAAGLAYEVVWMRSLALVFGVTTYATATVLATFMGGLALGSWLFGRWVDRHRRPLRVYALLEVGIGVYALCVPLLFDALRPAYVGLSRLDLLPLVFALARALLVGSVLLVPTVLMGGTLPVLVRFLVRRLDQVGRRAGALYFANTGGAVAGCLAAGFFLVEQLGLRGATQAAAFLNFGVAAVALALDRAWERRAASARPPEPDARDEGALVPVGAARLVVVCIGLSGFTALAYEVLWTRALLRYLYNSTYAFTTMLSTFLAGLAVGSALFSLGLARLRRPLLVFAALQTSVGLGFVASALLFADLSELTSFVAPELRSFADSLQTMFAGSVLILFLPTVFLGASLPLATSICTRSVRRVGAGLGSVYAANTAGAILGSLAGAFVLIPSLGMQGSLVLLVALNLATATALAVAGSSGRSRRLVAAGAGALLVAATLLVLPDDLFRRTFTAGRGELVYYREGATDTVGVVELPWKGTRHRFLVFDDLRGTAGTMSVGLNHFQGHLPFLLHPGEPRKALHIGLGVGNSLAAVASHEGLERVDSVELSENALRAAPWFWTNDEVLSDPKVRSVVADGRTFVMTSPERYDVIVMEPPEAFTSGVINLYTREFYRDAAERLAPGGLLVQWLFVGQAPFEKELMLLRAFQEVFPQASLWRQAHRGSILLVGSKGPFRIDYRALRERMREGPAARDLSPLPVVDADHLLSFFLLGPEGLAELVRGVEPVTEDRTVVDFVMPRYAGSGYGFGLTMWLTGRSPEGARLGQVARLREYAALRRSPLPYLRNTGGASPRAIEARIRARRALAPDPDYPPSRWEWKRLRRAQAPALRSPSGMERSPAPARRARQPAAERAGGRPPARLEDEAPAVDRPGGGG